jgi:ATP-dependent DNA ligase
VPERLPMVLPMLAVPSMPFDSTDFWFEFKWDGIRGLLAVEAGHVRLWGRGGADYTDRYPDLQVLGKALPCGTLLDGELVAFAGGRPDLAKLLRRHFSTDPFRISQAWRWCPVQYVAFDLLYSAGQSRLREPLEPRRTRLAAVAADLDQFPLVVSSGVVGRGNALFAEALALGHEGVMAKQRRLTYRPGQRSPTWRKIKPAANRKDG